MTSSPGPAAVPEHASSDQDPDAPYGSGNTFCGNTQTRSGRFRRPGCRRASPKLDRPARFLAVCRRGPCYRRRLGLGAASVSNTAPLERQSAGSSWSCRRPRGCRAAGMAAGTPVPGLANVWVDPDGGSCLRTAKPRPYRLGAGMCATVQLAAAAAAAGDLVLVARRHVSRRHPRREEASHDRGRRAGEAVTGTGRGERCEPDAPPSPRREPGRPAQPGVRLRVARLHALRLRARQHLRRRHRGRPPARGRRPGEEGRAPGHGVGDGDRLRQRRDPRCLGLEGVPGRCRPDADREHDVPRHPPHAGRRGVDVHNECAYVTGGTTRPGAATGSCSAR